MALLDEQLVEEWLNRNQFFTMRGIKCGVGEIDLLALKYLDGVVESRHVEVQVSFRPIGYIGGNSNARKRTEKEIKHGVKQWVEKKFTCNEKKEKRDSIMPNTNWRYIFVHGVLKDDRELGYMKKLGIELVPYKQVLTYLQENTKQRSSSVASNITEILKYFREV